jgi:hypothetical protein
VAALAAALGASFLSCASASARIPQTIAFTSTPPGGAVAGESYEVSASSSSPVPAGILADGACSLEAPKPGAEQHLPPAVVPALARAPTRSPVTVHFVGPGICSIRAESLPIASTPAEQAVYGEYAPAPPIEQRFVVAKNPLERITFTSAPPNNATVGGSYNPSVISSEAILVSFFSVTPSVCRIGVPGPPGPIGNMTLKLEAPGTCTLIASQAGSESEADGAPEAKQSFEVSATRTTSEAQKTSSRIVARSDSVEVPASCGGTPISVCKVSIRLTARMRLLARPRGKTWISVGSATETLFGGETTKSTITFNRPGRRLLERLHKLMVSYSVTSTPQAPTGTIVVHVSGNGGPPPGGVHPLEEQPLRISRLGPHLELPKLGPRGEVLNRPHSIETSEHVLHVAPGEYEVEALDGFGGQAFRKTTTTVAAGQEVVVTMEFSID